MIFAKRHRFKDISSKLFIKTNIVDIGAEPASLSKEVIKALVYNVNQQTDISHFFH